jgi:hypothetical protein
MLFNFLCHFRPRPSNRCPRRPLRCLPQLEPLESRDLLSGGPPLNVNTDTEGVFHAETTLAVNTTDPRNMIGSAADTQVTFDAQGQIHVTTFAHAHVTFDGGKTWKEYQLHFNPQQFNNVGDPAVAFDADGTAYLSALGVNNLPNGDQTGFDVLVAHSVDGGKNWSNPKRVATGTGSIATGGVLNDKDYLVAWGHGNALVTWVQVTWGPGTIRAPIFARVTHDGGKTWADPVEISGAFVNDEAPVSVVAQDGSVYVAFLSFDEEVGPQFRDHYKVVKLDPSTGQPLGAPVDVGLTYDGVNDYPVNVAGDRTYQDSQFRAPLPIGNVAADPTNAKHLAVIWSDMRNNPYPGGVLPSADPYQVHTNSEIIVSQSFDGGKTWSVPTFINKPNEQFQPWGAYDADGRLQIGYYDRSYDPANHQYGYTLASEKKPGSLQFTFQQVTSVLSDPTQGCAGLAVTANSNFPNAATFIGDYSNIAISPYGVAALWTDKRLPSTVPGFPGSTADAFFALVRRADDAGDDDHQGGAGADAFFASVSRAAHFVLGSESALSLGYPTAQDSGFNRDANRWETNDMALVTRLEQKAVAIPGKERAESRIAKQSLSPGMRATPSGADDWFAVVDQIFADDWSTGQKHRRHN